MYNVVCLKWGDKYTDNYVNKLYGMVKRNMSYDFQFYCFTDKNNSLREEINVKPLSGNLTGWWNKVWFFSKEFKDAVGNENPTLYLDLDVVIVDDISQLFDVQGDFIIIKEWQHTKRPIPRKYNSSVFRFVPGKHVHVWEEFMKRPEKIYKSYSGDQDWISEQIPDANIWPEEWCKSYKWHCIQKNAQHSTIPKNSKIIIFHGKPNPDEALYRRIKGYPQSDWIADYWKE